MAFLKDIFGLSSKIANAKREIDASFKKLSLDINEMLGIVKDESAEIVDMFGLQAKRTTDKYVRKAEKLAKEMKGELSTEPLPKKVVALTKQQEVAERKEFKRRVKIARAQVIAEGKQKEAKKPVKVVTPEDRKKKELLSLMDKAPKDVRQFQDRTFRKTYLDGKVDLKLLPDDDPIMLSLMELKSIFKELEGSYAVVSNKTLRQIDRLRGDINRLTVKRPIIIRYYDPEEVIYRYYRLDYESTKVVISLLIDELLGMDVSVNSSDSINIFFKRQVEDVYIYEVLGAKKTMSGSLFPFYNTSEYNLLRYQIIKQVSDIPICEQHCLVYALDQLGLNIDVLKNRETGLIYGYFPKKDLRKIAEVIEKNLVLHWLDKQGKHRNYKYKPDNITTEEVHIALYERHYFIYELTEHKIKGVNGGKRLTSLQIIKHLKEQNAFVPSDDFHMVRFYNSNTSKVYNIDVSSQRPFKIKKKYTPYGKTKKTVVLYGDSESCLHALTMDKAHPKLGGKQQKTYKTHQLMLIEAHGEDGSVIKGHTTFESFLSEVNRMYNGSNVILYFHNLKFDWRLIRQCKYVRVKDVIQKQGNIYEVKLMYRGMDISLRDSLKHLTMPLSAFKQMFQLESGKKELIMYPLYTSENSNNLGVTVEKWNRKKPYEHCLKLTPKGFEFKNKPALNCKYHLFDNRILLPSDIIPKIKEQCNFPLFSSDDSMYYHMAHMKYYLSYDCKTLKEGMMKFKDIIQDKFGLHLHDYLTISSLAHKIMSMKGVYDGVYEVGGSLQEYINSAVQGGRVATKDNRKWWLKKRKIRDFDAVSLYPSAMLRLNRYPIGPAKRLTDENILDTANYYVVTVKCLEDTKPQQIPFIATNVKCTIDGKKVTRKLNTNMVKDVVFTVDKYTLEDWVKFCNFKYEILDGVYWNEGVTEKAVGDVVNEIFNLRLEAKKAKNEALQQTYKLILNASYGKTILKRSTEKTICKPCYSFEKGKITGSPADDYMYNNIGTIKDLSIYGNTTQFTCDTYSFDHYNLAHIGCQVLSMSKRIMNEVMSLAEDLNIDIYYQDTDSMHIPDDYDQINTLAAAYRDKYGRELIGSKMGQFHSDFQLGSCNDVYSDNTIILGKKAYIDVLEGTDHNGDSQTGYHVRMKGINQTAISCFDPEDLYTKLYNNEKVEFDLASKGKLCIGELFTSSDMDRDASDKFTRTTVMYSKEKFVREVSFPDIKIERLKNVDSNIQQQTKPIFDW